MIYIDNASTSFPKPPSVAAAITDYLTNFGVSSGRSDGLLSQRVQQDVDGLRGEIKGLLGVQDGNVFFAQNATHASNVLLKGKLQQGDHVLVCNFSHNAIIRPLTALSVTRGVTFSVFNADQSSMDLRCSLSKAITPKTKLICVNHTSNILGCEIDIDTIVNFASEAGISTLVDATQSLGTFPFRIKSRPEYIVGTGHKSLLGPTGIGFVYARRYDFDPLIEGGTGYHSASPIHPLRVPDKYEAGTQNITGIVGLLAGIKSITEDSSTASLALAELVTQEFRLMPEVTVYRPRVAAVRAPIVAFNVQGAASMEIAEVLAQDYQICVRGGLQCAPYTHKYLGTAPNGIVRASFGKYSSQKDAHALIDAVIAIICGKKFTRIFA
jgi:selenocysteine lyase/cysteine desulfurase